MALPVSLFLDDLEVLPRRSQKQPWLSVVVSSEARNPAVWETVLSALLHQDVTDLEIMVVDDGLTGRCRALVDEFWGTNENVVVLRFNRCHGIPAVGVIAALQRATGKYIAYQTGRGPYLDNALKIFLNASQDNDSALVIGPGLWPGMDTAKRDQAEDAFLDGLLHRRELLDRAGWADPHVLMVDDWAQDLAGRLREADQGIVLSQPVFRFFPFQKPFMSEVLVGQARLRPRPELWRPESLTEMDVMDSSFLPLAAAHRFGDEAAAPYVARHWQNDGELHVRALPHAALRSPLKLILRRGVQNELVELGFGNYVRAFPDCLTIHYAGFDEKIVFSPEDDVLVHFRDKKQMPDEFNQMARSAGKAVLFAMDDNLLRHSEIPYFEIRNGKQEHEHLLAHLRDADLVLTWSQICAEEVKALNPRVGLIRTNVESRRLISSPTPAPRDGRLLFSTLTTHINTRAEWWMSVVHEWADFFRRHADKTRLVLHYDSDITLLLYRKWFGNIDYEARPYLVFHDFLDSITKSGFHVIISHIEDDNNYAKAKCPIKFLDATVSGAILVASDVEAYKELRGDVECLKVSGAPGSWNEALERSLALGQKGRARMWAAAREHVERDFTPERQYFPFFLAYEAARLHGVLGSRLSPTGKPTILMVESAESARNEAMAAWARLLNRQNVDAIFISPDLKDAEEADRRLGELLEKDKSIAVVLAPAPDSPWIPAARRAGLPVMALVDLMDLPGQTLTGDRADWFIALSLAAARLWRESGQDNVLRLNRPPGPNPWTRVEGPAPSAGKAGPVIGLVSGPDRDAVYLHDLVREALDRLDVSAQLLFDPGPCDLLVVTGHGAQVVDTIHGAMMAGIGIVSVDSAEADEILVNGVNGWSLAKMATGNLADLLAETLILGPEERTSLVQNARATAWARTMEEGLLLNLMTVIRRTVAGPAACLAKSSPAGEKPDQPSAASKSEAEPPAMVETEASPRSFENAAAALAQANKLMKANQVQAAVEAFREALEHEPSEKAFWGLVRSLNMQKQAESALREAARGLEQFPDSARLYGQQGQINFSLNRLTEAEESFEMALKINASQVDALHGLGRIAERRKEWEKALDRWHRCLALFPDHRLATTWWNAIILAHMELGRYDEATKICQKVLSVDPQNADAFEKMAKIAEKQGLWSVAWTHYDQCLAKFPDHKRVVNWRISLANLLLRMDDLDAAEVAFLDLTQAFPDKHFGPQGLHWVEILRSAGGKKEEKTPAGLAPNE